MRKDSILPFGPLAIVLICIGCLAGAYAVLRLLVSASHIVSIRFAAVFAGVLFESWRISDKPSTVRNIALGSLAITLLFLIPSKNIPFAERIESMPMAFLACFFVISIIVHNSKTVARLTEGVTLLQSMALLYWIADSQAYLHESVLVKLAVAVAVMLSFYAAVHAFTALELSVTARLILSIWSSIIMAVFAIEYLYTLFNAGEVVLTNGVSAAMEAGLQYFLAGVAAMYLLSNFMMLVLLPGKNAFLAWQLENHVLRYSSNQVHILYALCCVIVVGSVFYANYIYAFLPCNVLIWIVFCAFPFMINLLDWVFGITTNEEV